MLTHCWWQVSCLGFWELAVPYSNAIILKTKNIFPSFLFHLWNLYQILNFLKYKMIVIHNVFRILQTAKDLVRPLSKKRCLRTSFNSQHVKVSQTHVKSALEHFYHIFQSLWEKMILKISLLLKFELLGVFVNIFTADDKYPFRDYGNFNFRIKMQLS